MSIKSKFLEIFNKIFVNNQNTDILIKKVCSFYKNNPDYSESLKFLKERGFSSFPFYWTDEYKYESVKVYTDDDFNYVIHKDKKLYFPKKFDKETVKKKYTALLIEQDKRCSHSYFSDDFQLENNSIFCDVGCAEAIITLENIDKIKKAFLFECDESWIEALNRTFLPYKDKIIIINKIVSDKFGNGETTLDKELKNIDKNEFLFVKADIEGYERNLILGSNETFNRFSNIKMALCTYHNINDKKKLTEMLEEFQCFDIKYSDSYMIWPWLARRYKLHKPYFISAILRAEKK